MIWRILRNHLPESWPGRTTHSDLVELTQWSVETMHPGDWPEATEEDAVHVESDTAAFRDSVVAEFE